MEYTYFHLFLVCLDTSIQVHYVIKCLCFEGYLSLTLTYSGTEIVGPSKRKFAAIVNKYFYSFGQLMLAGVAYNLRQWSSIELAISLPAILFISYWW